MRYRTVGDMSCTAAVLSDASTVHDVITEIGAQPAHRARRHPRRRPAVRGRDGRPQARGVLLMAAATLRRGRDTSRRGRTLLRLATAGSVDDGKSTLVGRLLYDTNSVLTDTAGSRRAGQQAQGPGPRRPGAADRRPARRARAGHHHRRRLPLLRHPGAGSSSWPTAPGTCSTPATR